MAQNNNKLGGRNIKSNLEKLGFSAHDATVYLALLGTKEPIIAGPIISETGLHRNIVYTSLEHLLARKLVAERAIRGKKHFSIASPTVIKDEFARKALLAKETRQTITEAMTHDAQEITIHSGNEEYLALLTGILSSMPKGSDKYVLGTGGEAFMRTTMRPIWKHYHKVAEAQEIAIHMLGYESQRGAIEPDIAGLDYYDVHYLPNEIENPAGLHIYPSVGIVLNIIYSDKNTPVTAIKIKNKALTEGYLNLFKNLRKMAS